MYDFILRHQYDWNDSINFEFFFLALLQNCKRILLAQSWLPVCSPVRLSVRVKQLGSHWTDFHEIWYLRIFLQSGEKIKISLKSYKKKEYFTWIPVYIFIISRSFLLRMRNISDNSFRENQNTLLVFSLFFRKSFSLLENVKQKNIVDWGRPQMTIWHMHIACWIQKTTNTHSGCVILIAFPLQQWSHERTSMLRYTYIACLVNYLFIFKWNFEKFN